MQRVDDAELRGDAAGALDLALAMKEGPDGKPYWRPSRLLRLAQLAEFGPRLPRWVTSRWLLEQAIQDLDPRRRSRVGQAMRTAIEVQGGEGRVRHPAGEDSRIKVMDHNWVYRECLLYELGVLEHFLRSSAAPDVVAGADRIHEWARTPMGGFQLRERRRATTRWLDPAAGGEVETANIGSATLIVPGEWVIGRLVPIEDGRMFETVPMRVPEPVARRVAADPDSWLPALREESAAGRPVDAGSFWFGFVSDVRAEVSTITVYDDPLARFDDGAGRARDLLRTAQRAFDNPPDEDPEAVDVWACIATEVLNPFVHASLREQAGPEDVDLLARLGQGLAAPAAGFCRALAAEACRAA